MNRKQIVVCKEVEYLAVRAGEVDYQSRLIVDKADSVILTFRTTPKSFQPSNFALLARQARRLLADLESLFKSSKRLSKLPSMTGSVSATGSVR